LVVWSGNSNNGTAVDGAHQVDNGYLGKGFEFDGEGDYVSIPQITLDNNYTFSTWVYINGLTGTYQVIAGEIWQHSFSYDNSKHFRIYQTCSSVNNYGINQWHYVTFVGNTTNNIIYVNGALDVTCAIGASSQINVSTFGKSNAGEYFNGTIDDVMIFNRSLSAEEIAGLYAGTIDDVMIFNRSLSAEEIAGLYANSSSKYTAINYTSLDDGSHTFKAYTQDLAGNVNDSLETRTVSLDNNYPTWSNNKTNLTSSTPVGESVYFNITLSESNPDSYIFSWYNGTDWENTTSSYIDGEEVSVTKTININIGDINWTWYVNDSANNINQTDVWSVSLTDSTAPDVTINYPGNANISSSSINFNITAVDNIGMDSCWFSLDSGVTNYTMTNTTAVNDYNYTNNSIADGSYTANFWCNDTNNNVNGSESVSFKLETGTGVSFCRNLTSANTQYNLTADITDNSLTADCISITAQNITLDCKGYYISSDNNVAGVYSNQFNTTIKNCNISMRIEPDNRRARGIYLKSANNSYIYNNTLNKQGTGLFLIYTNNTKIENNTISSNIGSVGFGGGGIIIDYSNNNNITGNTLNSNSAGLVLFEDSSYNSFENNDIWNCSSSYACIYLYSNYNNNNVFNNNKINKSSGYGVKIEGGRNDNNIFKNTNMTNIDGTSVYIDNGVNNTFLNFSYNDESVINDGQLIRKWYYQAYVNDTDGNDVIGADVSQDANGLIMDETTNSSGWINQTEVTAYINDGTKTEYNLINVDDGTLIYPYFYNASAEGSNLNDVITFDRIAPVLNITYPTEGLNLSINENVPLNFTKDGTEQFCWWTTNSGVTNHTVTSDVSTSQGYYYPSAEKDSTFHPSGDPWTNEEGIRADDGNYATNTFDYGADDLYAYNFGFNLPDGAVIDGVRVRIQRYESAGSIKDVVVRLVDNHGNLIGDNKASDTEWLTLYYVTEIYGGASDKWGVDLTKSMVEDSDFGLDLEIREYDEGSATANIDYIKMEVYYTYPAPSCANTTIDVAEGSVDLTLYANDSTGNIGSDSVSFNTDVTYPKISITSPANNTNSSDTGLNINYTVSDTNLDSCWYSNDTMSANTTLANCVNITDVVWTEAKHNVIIWVNDSAGNENSSSVSFEIDITYPQITITSPLVNQTSSTTLFNVSINEEIEWCGLSLDNSDNITMTLNATRTGAGYINSSMIDGNHNFVISCNDSAGN